MLWQVAFVPQTAFIFGASVRDNILFGLPYDDNLYSAAVQAAALGPDLVQLPGEPLTKPAWLWKHKAPCASCHRAG